MGTISGFYDGLKTRASAVFENPSLYNITNWLTLGTADTVKGAVAPEKPLSLEHWLNALGTVSIAAGAYELAQKYAPTMIDDVAAFENTARHPFHDSAISSEYISDSEQLIQQSINDMKDGRLILMIAHRPSTIATADAEWRIV